jgi:hypothetical protein
MIEEEPKAPHAKSAYGSPRPHWGNHARKKYGNYKICDEHFYSYWVPGLVELIFPAGGLAVLFHARVGLLFASLSSFCKGIL